MGKTKKRSVTGEMIRKNNIEVEEASVYLGVSRTTMYRLVHDESFYPAFRIGRKILINMDKLEKWCFEQGMSGGENIVENN